MVSNSIAIAEMFSSLDHKFDIMYAREDLAAFEKD
jgi:hypothetical protein